MNRPWSSVRSCWLPWYRTRPFWGGLLMCLGGAELVLTTWNGLSMLPFSGTAGASAWLLGSLCLVSGITTWHVPERRLFPGVLALMLSLVSLVAANMGGLFLGFLLLASGGAITVAWTPEPRTRKAP
ncbi:DUF6114 domain-containing protein [Streptomyces sp. WM6378]|uniref:DUF6114 domain-containing protein n=1 Tax=Streptomyces sp. WM6378 TaxID=1415557 RepID=UPI000A46BB61|nr:DUF6114 domain-containing protein [Streptomyces sp. WM6378]